MRQISRGRSIFTVLVECALVVFVSTLVFARGGLPEIRKVVYQADFIDPALVNAPNGSGKDLLIQQTSGTTQINFDLQFINLPDGAILTLWSEQFQSVASSGPPTSVAIGTLTVKFLKVSEAINYAGFVSGNIDGLLITQPNGAIVLHANRFN